MAPRQLSPYEKTHLQRFGKGKINIANFGEMPVEYITGKVEFWGRVFQVNQDVLIPRIETEELITLALEKMTGRNNLVIADVGCGSGVIGISLWLELKKRSIKTEMYLSDISPPALEITKQNIANLIDQSGAVHLIKSDLLKAYPPQVKFDLIVANLPYIPSTRITTLDAAVKEYEPHLALDGGEDGLKYIDKLVQQAKKKINPGGKILLEVDHTHDVEYLRKKLALNDLQLTMQQDQFKRIRFGIIHST